MSKIFELVDDHEESKMYLIMEYCKYGTIQDTDVLADSDKG